MLFLGTEQFPEESSASVFAIIPLWRRLESAAPGNPVFSFCFWTRFRCLSDCEQRFFQRLHRGRGPSWLDPAMEPSRNSSSYWCVVHCLVHCLAASCRRQDTCFFFSCSTAGLRSALERFGTFFQKPLFTASATEREVWASELHLACAAIAGFDGSRSTPSTAST